MVHSLFVILCYTFRANVFKFTSVHDCCEYKSIFVNFQTILHTDMRYSNIIHNKHL